jgi:hypothetical protein
MAENLPCTCLDLYDLVSYVPLSNDIVDANN